MGTHLNVAAAVIACGSWNNTTNAGVWNRNFNNSRGTSNANVTLSADSNFELLYQ